MTLTTSKLTNNRKSKQIGTKEKKEKKNTLNPKFKMQTKLPLNKK